MKSSFAQTTPDEEKKPQTPAPTTAVAERASSSVVPDSFFKNEEMAGDFDRSDIQIPRFNLVQGVGPLSEHFQPGRFVYNKETDVGSGPHEITLLRLKKYFLEDLPYGSEQLPRIFNTMEDIRSAGFLPSWEKREMGAEHQYAKPVLEAQILLKGKAENDTFPFEFEGVPYAMALWTLQSVAYSRTAKSFITASQLGLRAGLATGFWTVNAKREKVGQNFIWLPIARQGGKNKPEFVDWAKSLA